MVETIQGRQRAWNLVEKLHEGDSGEVYRVESLLDRQPAILKRPRRDAYPSDITRQAAQIEREALILQSLAKVPYPGGDVSVPVILDRSPERSEFSERFFIVLTPAAGVSLMQLAKAARLGSIDIPRWDGEKGNQPLDIMLLQQVASQGLLPPALLLRLCRSLMDFLEWLNALEFDSLAGYVHGVLWNDIKVDHLYWDVARKHLTLIDWGNAQFLGPDGTSLDRLHTRWDDWEQFLDEMGRFFAEFAPNLHEHLGWPPIPSPGMDFSTERAALKARVLALLQKEEQKLQEARFQEQDILRNPEARFDFLERLESVQQTIISAGEIPDHLAAERYYLTLLSQQIHDEEWEKAILLCRRAKEVYGLEKDTYQFLEQLISFSSNFQGVKTALLAILAGDWLSALWELCGLGEVEIPSPLWEEWVEFVRGRLIETSLWRPFVSLRRLTHALGDKAQQNPQNSQCAHLFTLFQKEILPRWSQVEPDPPNAGLSYDEVERYLDLTQTLVPEATAELKRALEQPRAQVTMALEAWERRDFESVRRALRQILVWDPDRRRLFHADRVLAMAPHWLSTLRRGPQEDEGFSDFIARMEITAHEMRSYIAPAAWLDDLLEALKKLRKGMEATEVLLEHPLARQDLGWLATLEPRRPLLMASPKPPPLERFSEPRFPLTHFGIAEVPVGKEIDGLYISSPLDTWAHEARGSSARVFRAQVPLPNNERTEVALKVMRPDQAAYALPLFAEETRILSLMRDVPGVVPFLECGFLSVSQPLALREEFSSKEPELTGLALRFGLDVVHLFLNELEERSRQGWVPYLALPKLDWRNNLLLLSDLGYTQGRFLPVLTALVFAIQICDILDFAHHRQVVYRDHKILHYYWLPEHNGVFLLDWNIARRFPQGLTTADIQFDLVQFAARTLHYLFTGRPAPGALPVAATRLEEVESAQRAYSVQWTYDDQRLPTDIKEVLAAALHGEFSSARALKKQLLDIYRKLGSLVGKPSDTPPLESEALDNF